MLHEHIWLEWMEDYDGSRGAMCLVCGEVRGSRIQPLTDPEVRKMFGKSRRELLVERTAEGFKALDEGQYVTLEELEGEIGTQ